jgi:hypothetical protein
MPTEFQPIARLRPSHLGRNAFIRSKPAKRRLPRVSAVSGLRKDLVTLNNFELIARSPYRRRIFQMSALSTVDGRFDAYRGGNG